MISKYNSPKRHSAGTLSTRFSSAALGMLVLFGFGQLAFAHEGKVTISVKGGKRCIQSNGLPDHKTGKFPNKGNPNAIAAQNINLCVTTTPKKRNRATAHHGSIGIGINGVQFRPGTAGFYDASSPRGHSRDPASGWSLEGLNPANTLGMDASNAHVGPNGLYHYHGVANALVRSAGKGPIGYAADGFEIHYGGSRQKSSYQLKPGTRTSGPGGKYDGTYTKDWTYLAGSGTLDACNGGMLKGKFVYFATESYPYLPRCLWGKPSASFQQPEHQARPRANRDNRRGNRAAARENAAPGNRTQRQRRGPPPQAIAACENKSKNTSCSFTGRRQNQQVSGTCEITPRGVSACVPVNGRRPRG